MSNFFRLTNGWNKDVPRSLDLYELINVEHIPGRTGPIATIRLVTGTAIREISTEYLLSVSEEEVEQYLNSLHSNLLKQVEAVLESLNRL